jgi:hypothetical protein
MTLANFIAEGKIPVSIDKCATWTIGFMILVNVCFNNFGLMLSKPEVSFGFKEFITCITSLSDVGSRYMLCWIRFVRKSFADLVEVVLMELARD